LLHFHVKMMGCPAPGAREHVTRVEDEQMIAPDDLPAIIHQANAIGVTVEGEAKLGAGPRPPRR
jgi:hypothetical protein